MTKQQIIDLQKRIGTTPDGFWGPKSTKAAQDHLRKMMPSPHPFPKRGGTAFEGFYGPHGEPDGYTPPMKQITLPFNLWLYGDPSKPVKKLNPHEMVADSLLRVFERLHTVFPTLNDKKAAGILVYDGLYNPRKMLGSSTSWSMHAWAIAIDLNAAKNGNTTHWPTKAVMPIEVMECFAKEGWTAAGAFWSRDGMHMEATMPS